MFKKSLVALAITSVSAGAFAAADINTNTVSRVVSVEGATTLTNAAANVIQVDLGAEYTVGDIIKFTFAGADLDPSSAPASINPTLPDANDSMTLGLLNATASELTYRVTELTYDAANTESTIGGNIQFADLELEFVAEDIIANGTVTVTYSAETSTGLALDTPAGTDGSATLFTTASQFSSVVTTGFDATIDVNQQRLGFDDPGTTDAVVITPTNDSGAVEFDATPTGVTYTIYGDWSILDSDTDTDGVQTQANAVTVAGGGTVTSVDAEKIVIDHAGVAAQTITVDVDSDIAGGSGDSFNPLAEQNFTVDVDFAFTDHGTDANPGNVAGAVAGTTNTQTGAAAGSWTLNGANVTIPYMPFGPNTKVIMRATNTGTQTGALTVQYMLEGVSTGWESISVPVTDLAPGVTDIRDLVMDAIIADAGVESGKVAIDITVNAPGEDITVFAAYNVKNSADDRGFVGAFGHLGSNNN